MSAGSNVSAARIMTATTMAAVKPSMATYGIPEMASPQMAITTVVPANSTAWPAVDTATPAASSTARPCFVASRYRVTMNSE